MRKQKETRPSRQARGRECKSNAIVPHGRALAEGVILLVLILFAVLVLPELLYGYIAPTKGWI